MNKANATLIVRYRPVLHFGISIMLAMLPSKKFFFFSFD